MSQAMIQKMENLKVLLKNFMKEKVIKNRFYKGKSA